MAIFNSYVKLPEGKSVNPFGWQKEGLSQARCLAGRLPGPSAVAAQVRPTPAPQNFGPSPSVLSINLAW
jgi:hypothetical protein